LASPFTIINHTDDTADIEAIVDIVNQQGVGQIIVGLPKSMNGSVGIQAEKVIAFTQKLLDQTEVPIEFRDERLTTVSAKRLTQMGNNRRTRKSVRYDAIAAALILQSYLEERRESSV